MSLPSLGLPRVLKNLVSIKALLVEEGSRVEVDEEAKHDYWGRQKTQSVPFGMGNVVATEGWFHFRYTKIKLQFVQGDNCGQGLVA